MKNKMEFHKLFSFSDWKDCVLMAIGSASALLAGLGMPFVVVIFGNLINSLGDQNKDDFIQRVSKVLMDFILVAIGMGIASILQVSCWIATGERQAMRIRTLYLKAVITQDITYFDMKANTGEIIKRLSEDILLVQNAIGENAGMLINLASLFLGSYTIAFIVGWNLAIIMMACIPLVFISATIISTMISKLLSRVNSGEADARNVVEEVMDSIRTVVSFSGESEAIDKYNKIIRNVRKLVINQETIVGLRNACIIIIIYCSYGLAIWYASLLVMNKGYNTGTIFKIIFAVMIGSRGLANASPYLSVFEAAKAVSHKIFEEIHKKPTINAYDKSGIVLEEMKGDVELKDVYFSYPSKPNDLILDSFSLHVQSGSTMALVGESGSGKSTVVSLLERFYDPQAGEILIDGINLKFFKVNWIRKMIGFVSQEPILFMTTIKDNILYGKEDASDEDILQAIALANATTFIDNMPLGLETMVGDHGTQLSGGQKQRIAFARAILKNPKILLLDEATSALDAQSERLIHEALMTIMLNKTTIIIAHRLSTIKNADTISIIQKGKVIEKGSYLELIEDPNSAYSHLVYLQNLQIEPINNTKEKPARISTSSSNGEESSRIFNYKEESPSYRNGDEKEGHPRKDGHKDKKDKKHSSLLRLIYLSKSDIPTLLLGTIAAAINGLIFPLFGLLLSNAITVYYKPLDQLRKDVKFLTLMFVMLGVIGFCVVLLQQYLFGSAGGRLIERVRALLFEKILQQEISWFDEIENSSGGIGARLSSDASSLRNLVGDTLSLVVVISSTILSGLTIAFFSSWKLSLVILAIFPLIGLQKHIQVRFYNGFSADSKVLYLEATQIACDAIANIRTVASFSAEEKVINAHQNKCKPVMRGGIYKGIISGLGYGLSTTIVFCAYSLCLYIGAQFIKNGTATLTSLFRVFFAINLTALGLSQAAGVGLDTRKAKLAADSIFTTIDRISKIDSNKENGIVLDNAVGDIEFQHVSFKYLSRPEVNIFTDLCFKLEYGKVFAMVGESGSGKSTIISLMERFYDPDSGVILFDGVEIRKLKLDWLRQQMGLVSQEPVLFSGSIRSNIAYGKQGDVSEDEIIKFAEVANAHKFISTLSEGYDTNVGRRGLQLSGGQKQRIAIARAMIRNPKVLLLDEATSALDAESEHMVQEALDRVMVGRTTICIAHRLSTIRNADIINVLSGGVIIEQGSHDALMSLPNGAYASLISLQMA